MAENNAIGEQSGSIVDLITTPIGGVLTALAVTVVGGLIIHRLTRSAPAEPPKVEIPPVEVTVKTEPAPPPTAAEPQPNQIITVPRPNPNYTGRTEKLEEVIANLGSGHVASIVSIGGMGGVGKTETANVVAHRLLKDGKYKDGAVLVDLQGYSDTGQMLDTRAALTKLFDQIGQPLGAPPDNVSEADYAAQLSQKWVAETTGMDLLVILDNAKDAEQARPLLPGEGATALITSRERVSLPGVREVSLDRLDDTDALALIRRLCPDLSDEDCGAFLDMADGLPLLIEVAAPVISAADGRTPAAKIAAYAEAGGAEEGAAALLSRLRLSLEAMEREEANLFSGLSQFEGGFYAQAAGVMWGEEQADAERRLAGYAKRNLLIPVEAPMTEVLGARWRLHDQLRRVAADWLEAAPNRTALRHGWGRASLAMMQLAGELYNQHGDAVFAALALLDTELPNLRAAAEDAGAHASSDDVAAGVAMYLPNYGVLDLRLTATERIDWLQAGLPAARRLGDKGQEAVLIGNAAHRHYACGELTAAEEMYLRGLELDEELDRKEGMAAKYGNLGTLYRTRGDLDQAEEKYLKSLDLNEVLGRKEGMANQYGNLGILYWTRGDLDQAEEMYLKSLDLNEALGRKEGMASDYGNLGNLYDTRGDLDQAEEMYQKALDLNEALGRKEGMAKQYGNLGILYRTRGDLNQAEEMYLKSLDLNEALGRKEGMANQYGNLASLRLQQGRAEEALERAERECPELCVSFPAHAVSDTQASKRSPNIMANWFRAANHSRTFRPSFSNLRMAR